MDPLCVFKPSLIRFIVCANLLFGLLLFRNLSHENQENSSNQPAWYPSSESVAISEHANDQILQGKVRGVLSQIRSSLVWGAIRGRGTKAITFNQEERALCDFKRDEGLPKQVLLQKLVECYKEIITRVPKRAELEHENVMGNEGTHNMSNRRLLREITKKTSIEHGIVKNSLNNAAPFHLDYSGPQTHPPKNN